MHDPFLSGAVKDTLIQSVKKRYLSIYLYPSMLFQCMCPAMLYTICVQYMCPAMLYTIYVQHMFPGADQDTQVQSVEKRNPLPANHYFVSVF